MITRVNIKGFKCNRCKYIWKPRTSKTPKVCPACSSPYWNKKRVRKVNKK